jgi:hypothetical protein
LRFRGHESDTTTVQLNARCAFGGPARLRNLIHQAIPCSQPSQLAFLYQQGGSLWRPRKDIALEGDRTSVETQTWRRIHRIIGYNEICSHNEATVLKPVHVQRKQLAQHIFLALRSILVAHRRTAILMTSELLATCRPMHSLRPKPYETCPSSSALDGPGAMSPLASRSWPQSNRAKTTAGTETNIAVAAFKSAD